MPVARSYLIDKKKLQKAPHFRYNGTSGALTLVAAGSASAGHVYVLRNPDTAKKVHITRVRLSLVQTTAFGAAQSVAFAIFKLTGYTGAHTGGTAITAQKRRTSETVAAVGAARIATTAGMTNVTNTFGAQPLFRCGAHSTLPVIDAVWTPRDDHGEILEQDEGICVRNEVLWGASGVGVLSVEVDGYER
jgi:hypothetical protein